LRKQGAETICGGHVVIVFPLAVFAALLVLGAFEPLLQMPYYQWFGNVHKRVQPFAPKGSTFLPKGSDLLGQKVRPFQAPCPNPCSSALKRHVVCKSFYDSFS